MSKPATDVLQRGAGASRFPGRRLIVCAAAFSVGVLLLSSCGGSSNEPEAVRPDRQADGSTITIEDFSFMPATLSVERGTTIEVSNLDEVSHTLTADDGTFDTGEISGTGSQSISVSDPGTYSYHCEIHAFMTGTLEVG